MQNTAILPLLFLPPVHYFSVLNATQSNFLIEAHEYFPKQTFRNRASIYSPNGKLDITVPVVKGSKMHTLYKEVKISYDHNWQRLHWMSLQSCYRNSAYFEFYEDEFRQFYTQKFDYLFDYNVEITNWLIKKLKLKMDLEFTTEYAEDVNLELDFRSAMHPKKMEEMPNNKGYFQVFEDKHEFIPNLSIVDLLFNQGPQAKNYL